MAIHYSRFPTMTGTCSFIHFHQFQVSMLESEVGELTGSLVALQQKLDDVEAAEAERAASDEAQHRKEVSKLKESLTIMQDALQALVAPPPAHT